MARIWQDGFENNTATANPATYDTFTNVTIGNTNVRSGNFAAQIASLSSGTPRGANKKFQNAAQTNNFFRVYIKLITKPSAANMIILVSASTSLGSTQRASIKLTSTGTLQLFNATTQIGSDSGSIDDGNWHRVEMRVDSTQSTGSRVIEAKLDGSVFATSSVQSQGTASSFTVGGNLNSEAQTTGEWWFEDLAINDDQGSFQNTYPGDGKIIHLHPNGDGDAHGFTTQTGGTTGAANNYTRVKEVPPDDATTLNGDNTVNHEDLYNMAAVYPVFDAGSNSGVKASVGSYNWNHTVGASLVNGILVVKIASRGASVNSDLAITGITYNGVALTKAIDRNSADSPASNTLSTEIWYLVNPPSGTHSVAVTFTGTVTTSVGYASSAQNIDQTNPVDVTGGSNANGQASPDTTSVTTVNPNSLVFDVIYNKIGTALTRETHQTLVSTETLPSGGGDTADASYKVAPLAGSNSMSWTFSGSDDYCQVIAAFKAASPYEIGASDTVNVVAVGGRFKNNTADAVTAIKFEIEKTSAGTKLQSAAIIPNTTGFNSLDVSSPRNYPLITYQDPDGAAWTQATLGSMQAGMIISAGGTNRIDVTNLWVSVDYTPFTGRIPRMGFIDHMNPGIA